MTLIQNLLLLLLAAHLLGKLAEMLQQPALLGYMLAGVALGPTGFDWVAANAGIAALADFAVLFVVIAAGLEMRMQQVLAVFRGRGALALIPGFALPLAAGFLFASGSGQALTPAIVVGFCVSVTALPVALRILGDFGMLETPIARLAVAGALLSDVLVLLGLGILPALNVSDDQVARLAGIATLKLAALVVLTVAGSHACKRLIAAARKGPQHRRFESRQMLLSLLFILGMAACSEALGFHFAIGGFLAALMVSEQLNGSATATQLRQHCEFFNITICAPLFLAYQGLQFKVAGLAEPAFALGLIGLAVVTKMVGGYAAGRFNKLSTHDAWGVAIIMNARGVMEMVIASIAFRTGLVDQNLFSTLLLMGMATTVLTPLLLRLWRRREMAGKLATPADSR